MADWFLPQLSVPRNGKCGVGGEIGEPLASQSLEWQSPLPGVAGKIGLTIFWLIYVESRDNTLMAVVANQRRRWIEQCELHRHCEIQRSNTNVETLVAQPKTAYRI